VARSVAKRTAAGGGKGRVEVETLSMRSRPEIGEGTAGMRNRPVKSDPKLTVLLYVLTRRRGFRPHRAPPAALVPSPPPPHPSPIPSHPLSSLLVPVRRRRAALVMRWRDGTGRRGFGETRGPGPRHPRKLYANCKQKAAASNYFRPQATTVDNLITLAQSARRRGSSARASLRRALRVRATATTTTTTRMTTTRTSAVRPRNLRVAERTRDSLEAD